MSLGRYCGQAIPTNVSVAQSMYVKFRSDSANQFSGFTAQFSTRKYPFQLYRDEVYISCPLTNFVPVILQYYGFFSYLFFSTGTTNHYYDTSVDLE